MPCIFKSIYSFLSSGATCAIKQWTTVGIIEEYNHANHCNGNEVSICNTLSAHVFVLSCSHTLAILCLKGSTAMNDKCKICRDTDLGTIALLSNPHLPLPAPCSLLTLLSRASAPVPGVPHTPCLPTQWPRWRPTCTWPPLPCPCSSPLDPGAASQYISTSHLLLRLKVHLAPTAMPLLLRVQVVLFNPQLLVTSLRNIKQTQHILTELYLPSVHMLNQMPSHLPLMC